MYINLQNRGGSFQCEGLKSSEHRTGAELSLDQPAGTLLDEKGIKVARERIGHVRFHQVPNTRYPLTHAPSERVLNAELVLQSAQRRVV